MIEIENGEVKKIEEKRIPCEWIYVGTVECNNENTCEYCPAYRPDNKQITEDEAIKYIEERIKEMKNVQKA